MKLLHLGDLHLGARLEGISRLDEQKEVMREIVDIANRENVDAAIICGDVFDKSVPSAEAEDLFFETVEALSDDGKRFVLVIAGNHDDPARLGAGSHLAKKHNILIASDLNAKFEFKNNSDDGTIVDEVLEGCVKIHKGDDKCVIAYLPYPNRSRFGKDDVSSYEDFVSEMAMRGAAYFDIDTFNVFASHLFVVGGKYFSAGEEKEIRLGEALSVDKAYLPKAHYVALGHLHKTQEVYKNAYYSGSTTCARFYDKQPNVLVVDGDKDGVKNIKAVPLTKAYSLKSVEVQSIEEAERILKEMGERVYVELVCHQTAPIASSEIKKLKREFPFVMNIRLVKENPENKFLEKFVSKKDISSREIFENFYKSKRGEKPNGEMVELFLELLKGGANEAD